MTKIKKNAFDNPAGLHLSLLCLQFQSQMIEN